jgi:hypothetical protein
MSGGWSVQGGQGLALMGRRVTAAMREATMSGARAVLERQVDLLRRGLAPDGSPQRANDALTLQAKQRRGQGSTPLIATGGLARASGYQVKRSGNANAASVSFRLPVGRQHLLLPLRALGYRLLELSDADLALMRVRYSETLRRIATRGGRRS